MQITNENRRLSVPQIEPLKLVQPGEGPESDTLSNVAWMDAMGVAPRMIEQALGLPAGRVFTVRANPQYQELLRSCLRVKAVSIVQAAQDPESFYNSQILASAATVIEIRDNPLEKGATRLKAAQDMLDRAPAAPKVRKEVDERRTIISIPVHELKNMQRALIEEGTPEDLEMVELIAGTDYIVGDREGVDGEAEFEIEIGQG
jgi:hypothetical protein